MHPVGKLSIAARGLLAASAMISLVMGVAGCGRTGAAGAGEKEASMNLIAERYVRLALALGEHDPMYVDAYYGPEEWKREAASEETGLAAITAEADSLLAALGAIDTGGMEEIHRLRHGFLVKHLEALSAWSRIRNGEKMTFDEEARALYDTEVPHFTEEFFRQTLAEIDAVLPEGEGTLLDRLERFRDGFIIPEDRVAPVFSTVLEESRKRTNRYIKLPEGESFDVEYVKGTSWGAYNWYKGKAHSLIQVNTDLPTYIDSPLGLAAHEGYPGHHVYNALLESRLTSGRGWVEYSIYPLFSPLSLLAEGTANYGVEIAFPDAERLEYEKRVLYPIVGIDTVMADGYAEIRRLTRKLSKARIQAARLYLDGGMTVDETVDYLGRNALISADRARKLVDFFDEFRSYIINYYVGYDLVKEYIESREGASGDASARWKEFEILLSTPRVPSDLRP